VPPGVIEDRERDLVRATRALALVAVLALAGCGSAEKPPPAADGSAVIRAWADNVRTGKFPEAAELFALPALVSNGEPGRRLETRAAVDTFNRSFPCGAVLLGTQKANGGRLLATFRLTDGAGGRRCGPATGNRARVSFRVRDGRITEWLREGSGPPPGSTET